MESPVDYDDVTITNADYEETITEATTKVPSFLVQIVTVFENYGWYILICLIILAYLYEKSLKSFINQFKTKREEAEYSAKYHKNPDLLSARLLAQEKRTQELQEKYRRDAEIHKQKLEEKEAKKREDLIQKYSGSGQKLGDLETGTKNTLKPGYNPLTGPGSSSNYRPARRSACSGGGCG